MTTKQKAKAYDKAIESVDFRMMALWSKTYMTVQDLYDILPLKEK
jgi:hypothetical protein